jgi:hypothetical protein
VREKSGGKAGSFSLGEKRVGKKETKLFFFFLKFNYLIFVDSARLVDLDLLDPLDTSAAGGPPRRRLPFL